MNLEILVRTSSASANGAFRFSEGFFLVDMLAPLPAPAWWGFLPSVAYLLICPNYNQHTETHINISNSY